MGREIVTARVDVDGGFESYDVKGFFDASFDPVVLGREHSYVLLTEVVAVVTGVLQHCRLVLPKSIGSGGFMLLEAGVNCPFSFPYISSWAWC